ncbi:MAG: protein kinase [Chloroflexota bacterium]|nr:MAG: protein kinase [Chloroflexota bacterium]
MTSLVGQIIGHYRIDSFIGDGGMGTAYKAYDLRLERPVAIKVMHEHLARQDEFRARLSIEAKTAAQLDHASIVNVYELGEQGTGLYLVMEFIGGGSLREHLQRLQMRKRFLPIDQGLQIGLQIAGALDYAHQRGVIHRDVKPGNIILKQLARPDRQHEYPFRAILTDFGLVKLLDGESITKSGTTWGTPAYMSPEQCEGRQLGGRSDLYSLGVVLYELTTSRLPFKFQSLSEAIAVHRRGLMPRPAEELRGDVPRVVVDLLDKLLAKDPRRRFSSGQEMAGALAEALEEVWRRPTRASAPLFRDPAAEKKRRPGSNYQVRITAADRNERVAKVEAPEVTIGRDDSNDIVLQDDRISRTHARLKWNDGTWVLTDLGGLNGTWLEDQRLIVGRAVSLTLGAAFRIGPYLLRLELADPASDSQAGFTDDEDTHLPGADKIEPLRVVLEREQSKVIPGHESQLRVEIVNSGSMTDRVSLRVKGVPDRWVRLPLADTQIGPGQHIELPIVWKLPRRNGIPVGRQRFRVEVISQRYQGLIPAVSGSLSIEPFEVLTVSMNPRTLVLPGHVQLEIGNQGNATAEVSVVGHDSQNEIRYDGESGHTPLKPAQSTQIGIEMKARKRTLFGEPEFIDFSVIVGSRRGSRREITGRAESRPYVPTGIVYLAAFVLVFLCVILTFMLLIPFDRSNQDLTSTVENALNSTRQAQAGPVGTPTLPAVVETTPAATATPPVIVDSDGDRLNDDQELSLGTNPESPDTDGDGLSDGDEALTRATDPLNKDTDNDILSDGDEVNLYGTSPLMADTDGDGVNDGVEAASQTDPLDALDPLPTDTPTLVLPTNTPTPVPPTATPTSTPTNTPTATPTATATESPTETSTVTVTPTATATGPPAATSTVATGFELGCSSALPNLDGVVLSEEWGNTPMVSFTAGADASWLVSGYMNWVADQLFMAFVVDDDQTGDSESLSLFIDADGSGGDIGAEDRAYRIGRDGRLSTGVWVNSRTDGSMWNWVEVNENWVAQSGDGPDGQWMLELRMNAALDAPGLLAGNPFGLMISLGDDDSQGLWPEGGQTQEPDTWQAISNDLCN